MAFIFAETEGFGHELLIRYAHKYSRPRLADLVRYAPLQYSAPTFESSLPPAKIQSPNACAPGSLFLRRRRDSNPRGPFNGAYLFSKEAHSTTLTRLQTIELD